MCHHDTRAAQGPSNCPRRGERRYACPKIDDPLTEILRSGARRLITQAVEIEFDTFLALNADLRLADGRERLVRHGHAPVRTIQTGIGPVEVQRPKARDRSAVAEGERIRFTSALLAVRTSWKSPAEIPRR
jgi:hypothetical protein